VGASVTSGKPDNAGRLGTSIPKPEQISTYFTKSTTRTVCDIAIIVRMNRYFLPFSLSIIIMDRVKTPMTNNSKLTEGYPDPDAHI